MYRRLARGLGLAKGAEPSIPFGEQHVGVVEPRVTVTADMRYRPDRRMGWLLATQLG